MAQDERPRVLVISDRPDQFALIDDALSAEGLEVVLLDSAVSALRSLLDGPAPAAIITELHMPDLDGWRFCRLLRSPEYAALNATPALVLSSAFAGAEGRRLALEMGANAILSAPLEAESLVRSVRELLAGAPRHPLATTLIVEDAPMQASILGRAFRDRGYEVLAAANGEEARAVYASERPEIVFIDYHLPDVRGDDLLQEFRKANAEVVIVMATADPTPELASDFSRLGADAYLRKPLDPLYVVEVCERARRERALLRVSGLLEERTRQLASSEASFRKLFDNMVEGVALHEMVHDEAGRAVDYVIRDVNPAFSRQVGIERGKAIGVPAGELYGAASPPCLEMYARVAETGEPVRFEYFFASLNRRFDISAFSPRKGWFATVFEDISERARMETALRQSEQRYRSLFTHAQEAIFIENRDERIVDANPAACRMFGYAREELLQMRTCDLQPPKEPPLPIYQDPERVLEKPIEAPAVRKDGREITVELTVSSVREGDDTLFMSVVRDVTGRKRAEEALQHTARVSERMRSLLVSLAECRTLEEMLEPLLDTALEVCRVDVGGAFAVEGDHAVLRFHRGLDNAQTVLDTVSRLPMSGGLIQAVVAADGVADLAEVDPEAHRVFVEAGMPHAHAIPLRAGREVFGFIGIATTAEDPPEAGNLQTLAVLALEAESFFSRLRAESERRRLETRVLHAQKLESLGVLAGGIAHDFNNLLMGVLGNADLALLELSPVAPARENVENIRTAAQRASELTKQMLAYSGKGHFVVQAVDLNEVVEEMAHLLEVTTSKKAVLKYNFADNLPAVEADTTQLRQIIMNLITNASEAIGDKSGVISISTGAMECDSAYLATSYDAGIGAGGEQIPEAVYAYIEVADTGCGMDRETLERVFDPFYTTKFTGRGLGLAAVLGIVRGHRGAVKVYSEPGRGTTFKVLLPALDQPAVRGTGVRAVELTWRGRGAVLLVDDEETVRAVGRQMLEAAGFEVVTAADGREGVERFREAPDDIVCVVLDLTMPHMDGEEAFRELRRIRPDVRVLLSSGYNEQEIANRFAGKGLAGFIQKPYQLANLIEALKAVLGE